LAPVLSERILGKGPCKEVRAREMDVVSAAPILVREGTRSLALRQIEDAAGRGTVMPGDSVMFLDFSAPEPLKETSGDHKLLNFVSKYAGEPDWQ